jgi:glucose-1-phosphate adenylyltransferase
MVRNAIVDEGAMLPDGTQIGVDSKADRERFFVTEGGVVVVTQKMLRADAA